MIGLVRMSNAIYDAIILGVGSTLAAVPPAWVAVIGTVVGGILLKIAEHYLTKKQNSNTELLERSRDYRAEIKELTERLDVEEKKEEEWRLKYFQSQEEVAKLRVLLRQAGAVLEDVVE